MGTSRVTKSHRVLIAITLLVIVGSMCQKTSGNVDDFMNLNENYGCITPLVILDNGVNQTSTIYSNDTSAKIIINANQTSLTYNYSLNIVNNNASIWQVGLEYYDYVNITRVNATIILHNNSTSSQQIAISGGNISQINNYYSLTDNATIYIGIMNLVENFSIGETILNVYLRIKTPNTTTYTLYIITFEFS
ncbi:hypothetical protein HXY33_00295 [Candidatus Bathyarchaeota archaeon]|nr:hypothetical protein [Candidatus Bathyarchaeota archaeon]